MKKVFKWVPLIITILFSAYVVISSIGILAIYGIKALKFLWGPWIAYLLVICALALLTVGTFKLSKRISIKPYIISACVLFICGGVAYPLAINYNKSLPSMYAPTVKDGKIEITAEDFQKQFNNENTKIKINGMLSSQTTDNNILYSTSFDDGSKIQFECDPKTYYIKDMIVSCDDFQQSQDYGYILGKTIATIDNTFAEYQDQTKGFENKLKIGDTTDHTNMFSHNNINYIYNIKSGRCSLLIQA